MFAPAVSFRMGRAAAIESFDQLAVYKKMVAAEKKPVKDFGNFVRRAAKGLIRPAAKSKLERVRIARLVYNRSRTPATRQLALEVLIAAQEAASAPPGSPPRSVKGHLKKNIFDAWDSSTRSEVIGPVALGAGVAPHALEYGGASVTKIRKNNQTITRVVNIRPHPFMQPALAREAPKFPKLFAGALDRAA